MRKIINYTFISVFTLIYLIFFIIIFIRGQKDVLNTENRSATKIPSFSIGSFLNNEYQKKLEEAISDQFPGGETIKKELNKLNNKFFQKLTENIEKKDYYLLTKNYYGYDNSDYLLYYPYSDDFFENNYQIIKEIADSYNNLDINVEKYLYFVSNERSINFNKKNSNEIFFEKVKQFHSTFKSDYLKLKNFEDYKNFFYKTDHHWNYKGSYQGYKDIINLMFNNDSILKPIDTITYDVDFFGSEAISDNFYEFKEKFTVYKFDIPQHDEYINGSAKIFGSKAKYFNNEPSIYNKNVRHYGSFYGGDWAEVVYDFSNPQKDNLLILAHSDSNAINELIASHFNKTHILDLRHYTDLNIKEYIQTNKIDKLLYILNPQMLIDETSKLEVPDAI